MQLLSTDYNCLVWFRFSIELSDQLILILAACYFLHMFSQCDSKRTHFAHRYQRFYDSILDSILSILRFLHCGNHYFHLLSTPEAKVLVRTDSGGGDISTVRSCTVQCINYREQRKSCMRHQHLDIKCIEPLHVNFKIHTHTHVQSIILSEYYQNMRIL